MTKLAIIGAGSLRCSPAVLASLATYFGERPLEIRLYDADEERLDLFDRFARLLFQMTKATHRLLYRTDYGEALDHADQVVLQVDDNCARKLLKAEGVAAAGCPVDTALERIRPFLEEGAEVLSLQLPGEHPDWPGATRLDWLPEIEHASRVALPHQILRWIKGEEYPHSLLREHERSPLRDWLDARQALGGR
ncbi:MAG TPA: hypothetical protein VM328_13060 [Fimbriimonadaceae bacterium]|nr:hypothetical protein [Fimbriimonadaceae bacterium]